MYRVSFFVGGAFLVLIAIIVLMQIVGRWFGLLVPGADVFAGFSMAASFFMALPHTFKSGGHIRVSLVLDRVNEAWRFGLELWCYGLATVISAYFAWYLTDMAWSSYSFGDMSFGLAPTPLWLPQVGLALGAILLVVAIADEFVCVALGIPRERVTPTEGNSDDPLSTT